ncbi:MAG: DUF5677 domain-containing protein [Pseudomonadota bacterium]
MAKTYDELCSIERELLSHVQEVATGLCEKQGSVDHALTYYLRLIECFESCIVLMENKSYAGIPVISRGLLEGFADLVNIINNPKHIKKLYASGYCEKRKAINAVTNNLKNFVDKETIGALAKDKPFIERKILEHYPCEDKVKKCCSKVQGIFSKFDNIAVKAELANDYSGLYGVLCSYAHNNPLSVEEIHIEVIDNNVRHKLFDYDDNEFLHSIEMYLPTFTRATLKFFEHRSIKTEFVLAIFKKFEEATSSET